MKSGGAIWRTLWRLMVCAVLLFWIFHAIFVQEGRQVWEASGHSWEALSKGEQWKVAWSHGPRELWRIVGLVSGPGLVISTLFWGATIFVGMIRWRVVLAVQGLHLSVTRASEISLVAHFFNSFLLGSTGGDLLKAYYAARETHHKKTEAVMTVVVDRLLGLFAMLLFASVMVGWHFRWVAGHGRLQALSLLIVLMLAALSVLMGLSFWGGVSRRWPRARQWLRELPKGDLLERSLAACRQFGRHPGELLKILAISTLLNVLCVLQIWALVWGLGLEIPMGMLFVIVPIVVCISAIPITPSGLGVRENLYVWMLGVPDIAVSEAHALSLSLLAYACSLFWSVAGGLVYATRKERDHLAEIAEGAKHESLTEQV